MKFFLKKWYAVSIFLISILFVTVFCTGGNSTEPKITGKRVTDKNGIEYVEWPFNFGGLVIG